MGQRENFIELYNRFRKRIESIAARFSRGTLIPAEDYQSALSQHLWECDAKYKPIEGVNKDTFLISCLNKKAIDVSRSRAKTYSRYNVLTDFRYTHEDDAPTSSAPISDKSDYVLEDAVHKKKEDYQRQLVAFLLESGTIHNDSDMVATIEGIKRGETVNAIAKSLGLQRNTIDRKLQRLARFYDPKIHGDIRDYLPDGIRIKREYLLA